MAHKCCANQNSDGLWTCSTCSINRDKHIENISLDIMPICTICAFGNIFDDSGIMPWVSCEAPDCNKKAHKPCINIEKENSSENFLCTNCFNAIHGNKKKELSEKSNYLASNSTLNNKEEKQRQIEIKEYSKIHKFCLDDIMRNKENLSLIPCIKNWNAKEVSKLLKILNLNKEAAVFLNLGLDGDRFLSLTEEQIFKNFGFKLGPALKIWKHVLILRWRIKND
ncbi:hypothetical protein NPIL_320511 [Nephila pilipes]|uniref:SAM domain-containing protein n=1 Tax=Nephila pilipes TaxID=299642 RepID=A0A8X6UMS6_NEPPI|nr:hypothetical protein NPIL_320511 [Nephila pilipes]